MCERTTELPQNAETGAPRADASDGEKSEQNITTLSLFFISPFLRSEASQAKPKFSFNFLRLPPAPPAVFLKGKEIFGFARATRGNAPEARNGWRYHIVGA